MSTHRCLCRSSWIVLAVMVLYVGLVPPAHAAPPQPRVRWRPCYHDLGPFTCGTVRVPLDYRRPGAAAISIAVVRLPASDPAHRIGSLFLNPGGPGGSGFDFALTFGPRIASLGLGARFDIVGFDPRGISRSTALRCFSTTAQYRAVLPPFAFPLTPEQEALQQAADEAVVAACEQRAGRIIDHMTTADVARDLDLLRQAVGDEQMSYLGFSYDSYLGVTYANLFPDRVRAVVVDSVLDPRAWATGVNDEGGTVPLPSRLHSDASAEATLAEFFRLCDAGGPNCALAPHAATRFAQLAERLQAAPVIMLMPDGTPLVFTYDLFMSYMLGSLYLSSTWPDAAGLLAALADWASPTELGQRLQALREQLGLLPTRSMPTSANPEGQDGVVCSDTANPHTFAVWADSARTAAQQYPTFGRFWTWHWATCATWPGPAASRYAGPFTAVTARPALVVGSRFDPATPYEGAVAVHDLLPNSALLTVDGWGHGALMMSQCARAAALGYLLDGSTPPEGAVCPADVVPFADPPATALARASGVSVSVFTGALLPESLKQRLR